MAFLNHMEVTGQQEQKGHDHRWMWWHKRRGGGEGGIVRHSTELGFGDVAEMACCLSTAILTL